MRATSVASKLSARKPSAALAASPASFQPLKAHTSAGQGGGGAGAPPGVVPPLEGPPGRGAARGGPPPPLDMVHGFTVPEAPSRYTRSRPRPPPIWRGGDHDGRSHPCRAPTGRRPD